MVRMLKHTRVSCVSPGRIVSYQHTHSPKRTNFTPRRFLAKREDGYQPFRSLRKHRSRSNLIVDVSTGDVYSSSSEDKDDILCSVEQMSTPFVAETLLPTGTGFFRVRAYRHMEVETGQIIMEPLAIISGDVTDMEEVPIRVHDACFTSEVLGSLKCDCNEQLNMALKYMQENGPGLVIYLQQEGRGVGLANKIAAYAMQEKGLDTVDANRALGLPDDCREYTAVANILSDLNVKSIRLMTNNPRKINILTDLGINIAGRIPSIAPSNQYNEGYLDAKEKRMDHLLDGQFRQNHQDKH